MESGADRARGKAEELGDRRRLVSEVVAEDEDRALLRLEPAKCSIHDVAVDDARELVGR